MSLKTPRTGLAARMRAWMAEQTKPFSPRMVCDALELAKAASYDKVVTALRDFARRGEVIPAGRLEKQNRRQPAALYCYNPAWQSRRGAVITPKVHKAIYIAGTFSASDIARLSEADQSFVQEIVRKLRRKGLVSRVGRRVCGNGTGAENLYNIPNRDRYRVEVLK
jgi:hypothetical protein